MLKPVTQIACRPNVWTLETSLESRRRCRCSWTFQLPYSKCYVQPSL